MIETLSTLDPSLALDLCRRLVAAAVALAGLETLALFRALRPGGFLARPSRHTLTAPLILLSGVVRLVLGGLLATELFTPSWHLPVMLILLVAHWWSHAWLGYGNSGADPMIGLVLTALLVATLFPDSERIRLAVLGVIAGHAVIAYFTTGATKALDSRWRGGEYLHTVATSRIFGKPITRRLLGDRRRAAAASWVVIVFELAFPLALLDPHAAIVLCGAGVLFHLGNTVLLGLKNFVLAFAATYPAVIVISRLLASLLGNESPGS